MHPTVRSVTSALLAILLSFILTFPAHARAPTGLDSDVSTSSTTDKVRLAMELGNAYTSAGVDALLAMLGDADSRVRAQAGASLARLGASAFPAMIEGLGAPDQLIRTADRFGNPGRPPIRSDYIAYSFINSRSDPGSDLIRWTSSGDPGQREKRLHFTAVVLGARGQASLPHARDLLASKDPSSWAAGIDIIGRIGPAASGETTAVARRIFDAGPRADAKSVYRLSQLGEVAQPHLLRILAEHPLENIRVAAAQYLSPDPRLAKELLPIVAGSSDRLRFQLFSLLVEIEPLPAQAAAILVGEIEDEDLSYRALGALSRVHHTKESAQLVRGPLIAYVRKSGPEGPELEHADLALLALAATGPDGLREIERLIGAASDRQPLCEALLQSAENPRIEGSDPREEITAGLKATVLRSCRAPAPDGDTDLNWPHDRVTTENSRELLAFLSRGAYRLSEIRRACSQTAQAIDIEPGFRKTLVSADFATLGEVIGHCGPGSSMAFASELLARMIAREKEAMAWSEDKVWRARSIFAPLELLRNDRHAIEANRPFLLRLLNWKSQPARSFAVSMLAVLASEDEAARSTLAGLLADADRVIARQSAEALAALGEDGRHWDEAVERLIVIGVEADVHQFLEDTIDDLRPPDFMLTSGSMAALPPFPWPPPRYASLMMFGRDADRSLLGQPGDTLDSVQKRIQRTLASLDPGFQSSLFSVPGGFVILTRMEQIAEDGRPLGGRDRWRDVRPPPSSLSDFFVRLFLAPPGYYRTIAFLFTDQANFGYGAGSLPSIDEGGTVLPPDLAKARYDSRRAYALVYAFQKRDSGKPRLYTLLSAREHLLNAGLLQRLQSSR